MYAICRRDQKELDECGDQFGDREALHRLSTSCSRTRTSMPSTSTRRSPTTRRQTHRGAEGRQARRLHRADGARAIEECRQIVERRSETGQGLHDDGDGRLQPRVPVRQGAVRQGRARPHPVPPRQPPAGHGRLAGLLAGPAADAVRDALRQPVPGDHSASTPRASSATARADPRGADRASTAARSPSRRRRSRSQDSDVCARGDPQPLRHRPAVPRELRRLRQQEDVRVAAGRGRGAGASTPRSCPSRRSRSSVKVPDYAQPPARADPAVHDQGRLRRRRRARTSRSRRAAATAARTRTWSTTSCSRAAARTRQPFPNAETSANWTMVGICAHESALKGGELVRLPDFTLRPEAVAG